MRVGGKEGGRGGREEGASVKAAEPFGSPRTQTKEQWQFTCWSKHTLTSAITKFVSYTTELPSLTAFKEAGPVQ